MAAPTYEAIGTYFSADSAAINVGVPAGVVSGSVIVVTMFIDGGAVTVTPPSGFTQAENSPSAIALGGGGDHACRMYWKRATGADSGTYDFTLSGSRFTEAQAIRFSGVVASGTPFDSGANAAQDSSSGTVTPAVTVTTAGADRLLLHAATNWTGGTWTAGTGFTKRVQGGFDLLLAATKSQASAGSSGSVTATCTGSDKRCAWLGALIPTTAGGQSVAIGQSTETDAANAVVPAKSLAIGLATETDTANPIIASKSLSIGQATETDTANRISSGVPQQIPIGQVTETDTANPLPAGMFGPWILIQPTITNRYQHEGLGFAHVIGLTVYGDDTSLKAKELPKAHELEGMTYVFYGGHEYTTEDPAFKAYWISEGFEVANVP